MIPNYPYSDFNKVNLDWIMLKLKELEERIENLEKQVNNNV